MGLFKRAESIYVQISNQNLRFFRLVGFIFTGWVLFLTPYQIATAQIVHIPDPTLRTALESALGKDAGENITQADMANLRSLQASKCRFLKLSELGGWGIPNRWVCHATNDTFGPPIRDLTGLEFAINLTELHLGHNRLSNVSALENLTNLTFLDLGINWLLSNVSALENLTNLTFLNLRGNRISDVSPLKNLTKLIELDIQLNRLSDVSPLKNLTNLRFLDLRDNQISDASPLSALVNLTHLNLRGNQLSDVVPFKCFDKFDTSKSST